MKDQLERTFSKSSIKPIHRTKIGTHEVYIADGFIEADRLHVLQEKFGSAIPSGQMGREAFPNGCFATIWLTVGQIASRGGISLCKPDHDSMSEESKQKARISFAVNAAKDALIGKKLH